MSKYILIIDDDIHIGNLLEEALEAEGYQVGRAYSGTEALFTLERERPDLILLDLMLPGLSGEEVLPKLRGIPVIVVSAKADLDSKTSLLLGGAADYITKPFALRELLARVAVRLRETPARGDCPLIFHHLRLDPSARSVLTDGREVQVGQPFDRFFTVEAARRSTGLGLSIAKSLTERMGGTISARYEEGRLTVWVGFQ